MLILSGFVVPRVIDRTHGQEVLGIWDLAWSLASYFTLLEGGIGSSVNRHVALFREQLDMVSLSRIVSSVAFVQRMISILVVVLSIVAASALPLLLKDQPTALLTEAKWLVVLLGASMAVTMAGAVYGGVLTGLHRWGIHSGISAATNVLSLLGMCVVAYLGLGIVALSAVHLASEIIGRITRILFAYRLCPGLSITWSRADYQTIKSMFRFGGKLYLSRTSQIVMNQTVNLMIVSHLGPAMLALFARARSLVRQTAVFTQKYAFTLVPTAAALMGEKRKDQLRDFIIEATRSGLYVALPLMLFVVVLGESLVHLWMGPSYANGWLIAFVALGQIGEVAYQPLFSMLLGLNLHGRPAVAVAIGAGIAVVAAALVLHLNGGLTATAIAIAVPWTAVQAGYVPLYASRRLGLGYGNFLRDTWTGPLLCMLPYLLCLLAARWLFSGKPVAAILFGGATGATILGACYWTWVIPEHWKAAVRARLRIWPAFRDAPGSSVRSP